MERYFPSTENNQWKIFDTLIQWYLCDDERNILLFDFASEQEAELFCTLLEDIED